MGQHTREQSPLDRLAIEFRSKIRFAVKNRVFFEKNRGKLGFKKVFQPISLEKNNWSRYVWKIIFFSAIVLFFFKNTCTLIRIPLLGSIGLGVENRVKPEKMGQWPAYLQINYSSILLFHLTKMKEFSKTLLTFRSDASLSRSYRKISMRGTVRFSDNFLSFCFFPELRIFQFRLWSLSYYSFS